MLTEQESGSNTRVWNIPQLVRCSLELNEPSFQESLQSEVVPDVMANEQNLTADEEDEVMSQGTLGPLSLSAFHKMMTITKVRRPKNHLLLRVDSVDDLILRL